MVPAVIAFLARSTLFLGSLKWADTVCSLGTPSVHPITLKFGSLSAPVIHVFGRGKKGAKSVATAFHPVFQCTISSVKC